MGYSDFALNYIYHKTDGCCSICGKKLAFRNYARLEAKGAWAVDNSMSRKEGGGNYLENLFPVCVSCNQSKGNFHTR